VEIALELELGKERSKARHTERRGGIRTSRQADHQPPREKDRQGGRSKVCVGREGGREGGRVRGKARKVEGGSGKCVLRERG
jgi:hypothetical protein